MKKINPLKKLKKNTKNRPEEQCHLLVKLTKKDKVRSKKRTASGRKIEK